MSKAAAAPITRTGSTVRILTRGLCPSSSRRGARRAAHHLREPARGTGDRRPRRRLFRCGGAGGARPAQPRPDPLPEAFTGRVQGTRVQGAHRRPLDVRDGRAQLRPPHREDLPVVLGRRSGHPPRSCGPPATSPSTPSSPTSRTPWPTSSSRSSPARTPPTSSPASHPGSLPRSSSNTGPRETS